MEPALSAWTRSPTAEEVRKQWVKRTTGHIWGPQQRLPRSNGLYPCPDGSVEYLPVSKIEGESSWMYPAHYRIPPTTIDSLEQQEQINRQERFAFATLLYDVSSEEAKLKTRQETELDVRSQCCIFKCPTTNRWSEHVVDHDSPGITLMNRFGSAWRSNFSQLYGPDRSNTQSSTVDSRITKPCRNRRVG